MQAARQSQARRFLGRRKPISAGVILDRDRADAFGLVNYNPLIAARGARAPDFANYQAHSLSSGVTWAAGPQGSVFRTTAASGMTAVPIVGTFAGRQRTAGGSLLMNAALRSLASNQGIGVTSISSDWGRHCLGLRFNSTSGFFEAIVTANYTLASVSGVTTVALGEFYDLAAVVDGANLYLYVNGALEGSGAHGLTLSGQWLGGSRIGTAYSTSGTTAISSTGDFSYLIASSQILDEGRLEAIHNDPYQFLVEPRRRVLSSFATVAPPSGGRKIPRVRRLPIRRRRDRKR